MFEEEKRKMIELLEKLRYRISVSPDSPENENAKRVLARQMEKWGITEDDFKKLVPIIFPYKDKDFSLRLFVQIAYVKFGVSLRGEPFHWSKRGKKFFKASKTEIPEEKLEELKAYFSFYEKEFVKRKKKFEKDLKEEVKRKRDAFYHAFLGSAKLLAPATDDQVEETSLDELKRIYEEMEKFAKDPVKKFEETLLEHMKQIGVDNK